MVNNAGAGPNGNIYTLLIFKWLRTLPQFAER